MRTRPAPVFRGPAFESCESCSGGWVMVSGFAKRCPCYLAYLKKIVEQAASGAPQKASAQ